MTRKFLWWVFAWGLLGLLAVPAFAQSCALCYTQAASAGRNMIAALRSGILVLIVPPTLGTIGMFFVLHRRRNQVRRVEEGEGTHLEGNDRLADNCEPLG